MANHFNKRGNETTIKEVVERNVNIPIEDFIKPQGNPFIKNLREAVEYFKGHKDEGVTIVGDYDFDGISASLIMKLGLFRYGVHPNVRIPRRFTEGYGLSEKIIDEIESGLVITVDNGIASAGAIKKAKEKGLHVIITDHHLPVTDMEGKAILPDADVIVDPWTDDESEFRGYCGAAIAYRFIEELMPGVEKDDLLSLAAIATVADVMDLKGPNRDLVKKGIEIINNGDSVASINEIVKQLGLDDHVDEDTFGFQFGPLGNAPGRLRDDGADRAFRILGMAESDPRLSEAIGKMIVVNEARKKKLKDSLSMASSCNKAFYDHDDPGKAPIVLYHPKWGEGIIGLIASEICENKGVPVIAFTKSEKGVLKGSGRSVPGVHLKHALDQCKHLLLGYGGHEGAAGLSVSLSNIDRFYSAFKKACGEIPKKEEVEYDLPMPRDLDKALEELKECAPYGNGNPKPLFHFNFDISEIRKIGVDGNHIMINGQSFNMVGFGMWDKYEKLGKPRKIEVVGTLSENWFRGKMKPKVEIVDFVARD